MFFALSQSHKKSDCELMKVFRLVFLAAVVACVAVSGCAAGSYRRNVLEVEGASAGVNLRTAASGAAATSHDAGTDANGNDGLPVSRTATGGIINTLLSFLTVIAFIGNGAFMVYTLAWLSVFLGAGATLLLVIGLVGESDLAETVMMPLALLMAAMFFTSVFFSVRDSFEDVLPRQETPVD